MHYIQLEKKNLPDDPFELVLNLFGGIKKKLSGVRGQIQERKTSILVSSKDELITYFIKAFRKISEVSKNKKIASSSESTISTAVSSDGENSTFRCLPVGVLTLSCPTSKGKYKRYTIQ